MLYISKKELINYTLYRIYNMHFSIQVWFVIVSSLNQNFQSTMFSDWRFKIYEILKIMIILDAPVI